MVKKIKSIILSLSYAFALLLPVAAVAPAYAATTPPLTNDIHSGLCAGSNIDVSNTSCPANTGTNGC
jgi:hypothetical protein